jgi:hypothetical protein
MVPKHKQSMSKLQLNNMTVEEATEYLESIGEWHTVRNVPREVMVKWAEYLRNEENEISSNTRRSPKAGQAGKSLQESPEVR